MISRHLTRLAGVTLTYGVGGALARMINFLLLPVFTRYLTPADYGVSAILGVIAFLLTPVFGLGLGVAIPATYFDEDTPRHKETTIWTAFVILAASALTLTTLGFLFRERIGLLAFDAKGYETLVAVSLCATGLSLLCLPFQIRLQMEERAKTFVALTLCSAIGSISFSVLMVVALGRGVRGLVEAQLMGQSLTLLLALVFVASGMTFRVRKALVRELLRLGFPMIPSFAFLFVMLESNKYLLRYFHGVEQVGVCLIGLNMGLVMNLLVSAFTSAWTPFFMSFKDRRTEAAELFGRVLTYYVLGVGSLTLCFFIFAKPVVMLMTQPSFFGAHQAVGLAATAHFLVGVTSILLPAVYFSKEVKIVSLVQGVAALVTLALYLWLIPALGILGAALGMALGFFSLAVLQWLWNFIRRRDYLRVQYDWNRIWLFALFFAGYAGLMLVETMPTLLGEIVFSFAVAATLPVLLYLFLRPRDRSALWGLAKQCYAKLLEPKAPHPGDGTL